MVGAEIQKAVIFVDDGAIEGNIRGRMSDDGDDVQILREFLGDKAALLERTFVIFENHAEVAAVDAAGRFYFRYRDGDAAGHGFVNLVGRRADQADDDALGAAPFDDF